MSHSEPARAAVRRTRAPLLTAALAVGAALAGALLRRSPAFPSASRSASPAAAPPASPPAAPPVDAPHGDPEDVLGEGGGALPRGVTVFDDRYPGVANLGAGLLRALRAAAADAAEDGVGFHVNSGWRSPRYQERLLRRAVAEHGSAEEAARWVATADTSAHVAGNAVDIGRSDARAWLSEHGARYGLCQVYRNEPWHFELRPEAVERGCPAMYADPSQDPRTRR
ncbi:M15 family metallopeptidase [Saccharothrix algeriensis]|uniref:M15 family metallopeptidase n=1 Tax=Saccharothrix algeriensis TaxID=173560 RepID=A0A8T8HYS0_9PSEU|nr:M15 family metallopeptidase [Saccharothrix algeriensis]MBM7809458.1 hypothetical protein [Saccharothrix algeriensis]QTR03793.1 M15 family metallopeptidase [Saccharothrix algeriensis]